MSTINKLFFTLLLIVFSLNSQASLITTNGADVSFTYEDTQLGLYGLPTVSGNTVFFVPTNFQASSLNGDGAQYTRSTVKITLNALPGMSIISAGLTETGDYILGGANAALAVMGSFSLVDVVEPLTTHISKITPAAAFAPTGFNDTGLWNVSTSLYLANGSPSVIVSINNILGAKTSLNNDYALIGKNFVGLNVSTEVMHLPLPLAVWLFGGGLMSLLFVSKRKKII